MTRIGFLVDRSSLLSPEESAASKFLSAVHPGRSLRISFQSLNRKSKITKLPSLLWWHFDSSTLLPSASIDPEVITTVRRYVERGGSLLLSLLAAQYVFDLGFEPVRPNVVVRGIWSEDNWAPEYPDIRGFATFLGHPLFKEMTGGTYSWNPSKGDPFCGAFYEGVIPSEGKIIAVDRQYIRLNEERRVVCEYRVGKGRILTVGTNFFFEKTHHRFRPNLEKLTENCFSYLLQSSRESSATRSYWQFSPREVRECPPTKSRKLNFGSMTTDFPGTDLKIVRDLAASQKPEQTFDIGGRRIFVAGKERSGISEAWTGSVRILRNLETAFAVGNSPMHRTREMKPTFIARPECITRTYDVDGAIITETLFCDREQPSGSIHYDITSAEPVDVILTASIDLRLMWPLSDEAAGSLEFRWDEGLHAFVISSPHAGAGTIVGSSLMPAEHLAGQFSEIGYSTGRLTGKPTNEIVVSFALRFRLSQAHNNISFFFAGSPSGSAKAERAYRSVAAQPGRALQKQSKYVNALFKQHLQIRTPDRRFNEAFRWALVSAARFFVDIPGLGSSLFAGFGTTDRGWNGGHPVSGRPGYAWFFGRDSVWTCFALLGSGDFTTVRAVLEFLGSHQDPAGKIPHEVTTSGYAHYDAADATPLYLILAGRYLQSSGDVEFIKRQFECIRKAIAYCYSTDTDQDHLIENSNVGHGWVEGGQLFPAHTEHYLASCWAEALKQGSIVAASLGKRSLAERWTTESKRVARTIEKEFWNDRLRFYNFASLSDGLFREERTVLPAVGLSLGLGSDDHARTCLEVYSTENFSADWGVRIVGKDNPLYDPTGYHYGSVWPLFTGWTALAEFKRGRPLQGFVHAMMNLLLDDQFSAGTREEVLRGDVFEPSGVCSHQAWSESMAIQPMVDGMLGCEPDALARTISLHPYFPPDWNFAEVRNIALGEQRFSFLMERRDGAMHFRFSFDKGNLISISLRPYLPMGSGFTEIKIDGRMIRQDRKQIRSYDDSPAVEFTLKKRTEVEFHFSGGISLVPPVPHPNPGQTSSGLRVIDERWENGAYCLVLEGRSGATYPLSLIDQDCTVQSIEGATIRERQGDKLTAEISFVPSSGRENYQRSTIRCLTSNQRRRR